MAETSSDRSLVVRLVQQAKPYWHLIGAILLLDVLAAPLALLNPVPLAIAVDSVLGSEPLPGFVAIWLPDDVVLSDTATLALAAGLVVVIALLHQLQGAASWLLHTYTGEKLVLRFRTRLFRHAQRLSLSFHDSQGTADSVYRVQYDAPAIQWIAIDGVIPFLASAFTLVAMIYVTARIDWQLALIALAVAPVLFFLTQVYRRRLRSQWHDVKKLESSALSLVQEVLMAVRVVKAFGQEDREGERFAHHYSRGTWARVRAAIVEGDFGLLIGMTTACGMAAVLFIGVYHVYEEIISLGELLIVVSYVSQLYKPLESMGKQVTGLQRSLASAERAYALLDHAPDVFERPGARPLLRAEGTVAFQHVSFSYDGSQPVLRNVTLKVPAGSSVGIVGRTGEGKTTLVNLLTRFYDPSAGRILLDGVDLRDYRLADLRSQFAIVLQEPVLFSTSVAENIAYSWPSASEREIIRAARAANAHEFIAGLADGYDTVVGERGMLLSGGERQRIALARAFLKDAPVLIMDEPTSSVDIKTESAIMEAMERLMRGRTTFMIAHRLSTLGSCDLLLVLNGGRLIQSTDDVESSVNYALKQGDLEALWSGTSMRHVA